jgi:hypothetical protein
VEEGRRNQPDRTLVAGARPTVAASSTAGMAGAKTVARIVEDAGDELFSHILRSGVVDFPADQRQRWLADTMAYLADRYPALSADRLELLRERAERFCAKGQRLRR